MRIWNSYSGVELMTLVGHYGPVRSRAFDPFGNVAAEVDLINQRLTGTELQEPSVLPVLLEGTAHAALPPLVGSRVYADFRAIAPLRESVCQQTMRLVA